MTDGFKKLMLEQVQENLNEFIGLAKKPIASNTLKHYKVLIMAIIQSC